jgi:hypothetical protein
MIKEAMKWIAEQAGPKTITVDGAEYSEFTLHQVRKATPDPLEISTLTGVVDYITADAHNIKAGPDVVIHVKSTCVRVLSCLYGNAKQRDQYVSALVPDPNFSPNRWYDRETFIIGLMTQFVNDGNVEALLKIVGKIVSKSVKERLDDGITQTVETRKGLSTARIENTDVANPWHLRPYRTFHEVEQPSSPFVFRMRESKDGKDGIKCALFEADADLWKLSAIASIKAWLEERLEGVTIIA